MEIRELEQVYDTLDTLVGFCISQDLSNQYKNMSASLRKSHLTIAAEAARDIVGSALTPESGEDNVQEELSLS